MKNLKTIFELLLFPFLFLPRLSLYATQDVPLTQKQFKKRKSHLIFIILGIFSLSTISYAAYSGDSCGTSDNAYTFSAASDSFTDPGTVTTGSTETFYIKITRAGVLTLNISSGGNKANMNSSTNSCPASATSTSNITITATEEMDLNLLVQGTGDRTYSLVFTFVPDPNTPPTAVAAATPTTVTVGDNVTLDGSGSSDSDGSISSYSWTDGSKTWTGINPTISTSGWSITDHTITLTVTDNDGDTDTDTVVITVNAAPNIPPVADAGADQTVGVGSDIDLDGSGSTDSDGTITSYSWTDGSTTWTGVTPTISGGLAVGIHTITLTVTDNDSATDTDTVDINVSSNPTPPTISGIPDQDVTVDTVFTDLNLSIYTTEADGDPITFTTTTLPTGLTLSGSVISGTPTVIGLTTVTVMALDKDGNDTDSFDINVTAAPEADLNITKTALDINENVATSLPIDGAFQYIIDVSNSGPDDAENIVVTDVLPTGLSGIDLSNTDATLWTCTESSGTVTCNHIGDLSSGLTHNIIIDVTAPSTVVTLTNNATVTSDNDPDTSNNSTSLDTDIVSADIDNADDLCYINLDPTGSKCEIAGDSYYADSISGSNGCTSNMVIRNQNLIDGLTDVNISKIYDPGITNGSCSTSIGTCTITLGSGGGYQSELGNISADTNITFEDINSYNSSGITDIVLSGEYSKGGFNYSGELSECPGQGINVEDFVAQVDVVDQVISTTSPYIGIIKTKVSNRDNYTLTAQYLGANGAVQDSATTLSGIGSGGQALDIPMVITYFLTDETCSDDIEVPLYRDYTAGAGGLRVRSIIEVGDSFNETDTFTMSYNEDNTNTALANLLVKKIVRVKYKAIDLNALFDYAGETCIGNSSIDGGIKGVPQCITSQAGNSTPADRYKTVFGQDAYDRCWGGTDSNGDATGSPCLSSSGGFGLPPYDNEYGCLECSIGEFPWSCSQDNFAIRPDNFDISSSDLDFPNLLRAGEDYNHTVLARHDTDISTPTHDYNQTKNNLDLNQTRYFANDTVATGTQLHGTLVWSAWDFNVTDGVSHQGSSLTPTEVAGVQYDDVGKINLSVEDRNWAAVDIDNANDPTTEDCDPDGAYICGDQNVTYIPHHFGFSELNITNRAGPTGTFTYIADNRGMPSTGTPPTRSPMAARIHAKIEALTKDGNITENFRTEATSASYAPTLYYENPVSITPVVTVPSSGTDSYLYPDANESNVTTTYIGFGRTGFDDHGTRKILWDESEFPLEFNFQREINEEANPFDVNGTYMKSITVTSHYIDPDDGDTADINGSRISEDTSCGGDDGCVEANAENNATFYYARSRSSKVFYEDVTTDNILTPIIIDIYCDLGVSCLNDYDVEIYSGQITNNGDWFISMDHTNADGNLTLMVDDPLIEGTGSPSVNTATNPTDTEITTWTNGTDGTVVVDREDEPVPLTVPIKLVRETDSPAPTTYTHEWLIYDPDALADFNPFYKVRFIGDSAWTGTGITGDVVNINASRKKSKKMDW